MRGPGRAPEGAAPGRWLKVRPAPPGPPGPPGPEGRGVNVRPPCPPDCCGRMGWPGRGPLGRRSRSPGAVPGTGPRFPVGMGRRGCCGRGALAGDPERAACGCVPGCCGRDCGGGAPPGRVPGCWPGARVVGCVGRKGCCGAGRGAPEVGGVAGAAGRSAAGAAGGVVTAGAGAAGFATGATGDGVAPGGGAAGAGLTATGPGAGGAAVGAGAAGFAATGGCAGATGGAAGAGGLLRAAFAAASFAERSASAAVSASATPFRWSLTFSATSSGIELECVFFSVTPKPGNRSMMAFALTSSSRASSLMRT